MASGALFQPSPDAIAGPILTLSFRNCFDKRRERDKRPIATRMVDLDSYTQSFKLQSTSSARKNDVRSVRKRKRQPVSCRPCRSRRSKCDRSQPCSACKERNGESSCSYAAAGTAQPVSQDGLGSPKVDLRDRLQQLESLVSQMVSSSGGGTLSTPAASASSCSGSRESSDQSHSLAPHGLNGVGKSQWSAVLDETSELRFAGGLEDDATNTNTTNKKKVNPDTLLGASRPASLKEVLQRYLPPKLQVDQLLSRYFNATYIVVPILHSSQFQRQYETFWRDPCDVDSVWAGTLFAVLCISASISFAEGSENDPTQKDNFLAATAQCLVFSGYTSPELKMVQALLLFTHCKYMASLDPPWEITLLLSMVVRLAFQIGLHREPDSSFSAFEGEVRRRLWAMCRHFDLVVSYQLGLPSNIPHDWHDTKSPRNLLDEDFDEHSSELPPSRPEEEVTRVLYFVVKTRLTTVFGQIYHQALSLQGLTSQDIVRLEAENQKQYDSIPKSLRIRPMSQSFTSPNHVIMARLTCEFAYQRSTCILHRQGMVNGDTSSRNACLRSAMAMVSHLADIHKEFLPHGQLRGARWMLSSTTMSDFLLATVILCLVLSTARRAQDHGLETFNLREWMGPIDTLEKAHAICVDEQTKSRSAARVANAAGLILLSLGIAVNGENQSTLDKMATGPLPTTYAYDQSLPQLATPPSQQTSGAAYLPGSIQETSMGDFNVIDLLDDPESLDWAAIDQYLNFAAGPA